MFFSAENNRYLQPLARFLGPEFTQTQNAFAVGALPRTPLGELTALSIACGRWLAALVPQESHSLLSNKSICN